MSRVTVEWMIRTADGSPAWERAKVKLRESRRGNGYFRHEGQVYVVTDWKLGSEVLVKMGEAWVRGGRVARGPGGHIVFLGEGLTYSEYTRMVFLRDLLAAGKTPIIGDMLSEGEAEECQAELAELEKRLATWEGFQPLSTLQEIRASEPHSEW